jgi:hypothetical protein
LGNLTLFIINFKNLWLTEYYCREVINPAADRYPAVCHGFLKSLWEDTGIVPRLLIVITLEAVQQMHLKKVTFIKQEPINQSI